jgi:hypothetical protein
MSRSMMPARIEYVRPNGELWFPGLERLLPYPCGYDAGYGACKELAQTLMRSANGEAAPGYRVCPRRHRRWSGNLPSGRLISGICAPAHRPSFSA